MHMEIARAAGDEAHGVGRRGRGTRSERFKVSLVTSGEKSAAAFREERGRGSTVEKFCKHVSVYMPYTGRLHSRSPEFHLLSTRKRPQNPVRSRALTWAFRALSTFQNRISLEKLVPTVRELNARRTRPYHGGAQLTVQRCRLYGLEE